MARDKTPPLNSQIPSTCSNWAGVFQLSHNISVFLPTDH